MTGHESAFPNLLAGGYSLTSPVTSGYNCIAWAAGDAGNWWWPDPAGTDRWPDGAMRAETLDAFAAAFATLGFVATVGSGAIAGIEKVAVYSLGGKPTHAARQLPSGRWTSKLGSGPDIEHDLAGLEGDIYGNVAFVMERPTAT